MEVFLCESLVRSSLNSDLQPLWVVRLDKEGASCLCLGRLSDPKVWIGFQHFIFFTLNVTEHPDNSFNVVFAASLPLGHLHLCHHFLHLLIDVLSSPSPSSSSCNSGNSGHDPQLASP